MALELKDLLLEVSHVAGQDSVDGEDMKHALARLTGCDISDDDAALFVNLVRVEHNIAVMHGMACEPDNPLNALLHANVKDALTWLAIGKRIGFREAEALPR